MFSLGIDIGTSGVRTAVLDKDGRLLSSASLPHIVQNPEKTDADLWWKVTEACLLEQIRKLKEQGLNPFEIVSAAVDGTSGTLLLIDKEASVQSRALLYNSTGFEQEARQIAKYAPAAHITQGENSALARLIRLFNESGRSSGLRACHQADFVLARLTGKAVHSDYNNALKTGFDPQIRSWPDWFGELGLEETLLPEVHAPGAPLFPIESPLARRLGLSPDLFVHAGTTDSIAAFLACGSFMPGLAVTSLGTTLAVKQVSWRRIDDPALGLYSHSIGDYWLAGGASNSGGGVLRAQFPQEQLERLSAEIDPLIPSELDYYPLNLPGERFPVNDPNLQPRMLPRPENDALYLKGLLEGIARIEKRAYDLLAARGAGKTSRLITAGGGAHNKAWTKIRERVLGLPIETAEYSEASVGVARLAQQHLHLYKPNGPLLPD